MSPTDLREFSQRDLRFIEWNKELVFMKNALAKAQRRKFLLKLILKNLCKVESEDSQYLLIRRDRCAELYGQWEYLGNNVPKIRMP